MRIRTWLCAACALLIGACSGGNKTNTATGSSDGTVAAEALTKGVSFNGGNVVLGALPQSTLTNLTLVPAAAGSVLPGDTALMSLDVDNPDGSDPIAATLLQFDGAADHIEVPNTGTPEDAGALTDASAAADAGGQINIGPKKSGKSTLKLSFAVSPKVCVKLCDTKFTLTVSQAVKLGSGGISVHVKTTIDLDCTSTGDHRLCPSGTKTASGKTPGANIVNSFAALNNSLCTCNMQSGADCNFTSEKALCSTKVLDNHASDLASQAACMQKYLDDQQACLDKAKCLPSALSKCDFVVWAAASHQPGSGDPFTKPCGAMPQAVKNELDTCGSGTDAGTSSVEVFMCTSGEQVTKAQLCDGKQDCKDNGDEGTTVCAMCTDGVGKYYTGFRCDGHNDCADASDEANCPPKA